MAAGEGGSLALHTVPTGHLVTWSGGQGWALTSGRSVLISPLLLSVWLGTQPSLSARCLG